MEAPLQHQKALIDSGQWVLYRNNPKNIDEGKNPLTLDSAPKKVTVEQYMNMENRFKMLWKTHPEDAKKYYDYAKKAAKEHYEELQYLAGRKMNGKEVSSDVTEKQN